MTIERKDKLRNKAKVIKAVLKDPLASQNELVKKTWLWKGTVNRNIRELDQNWPLAEKDDRILWVCDTDFEIIQLTQGETVRRIKETPEEISMNDLIRAWAESTKRYTIFKWEITDKDWGMKNNIKDMTLDELLKIANG